VSFCSGLEVLWIELMGIVVRFMLVLRLIYSDIARTAIGPRAQNR
jgi:hypothetical protein